MASSVFYKWASRKDESRVTFDGTGISVFDLKRDIILANKMEKANDFDLVILDAASRQEYGEDSFIIPRSSSVIVKRVPAARHGKGRAGYYTANSQNIVPTSEPVRGSSGSWHKGAMSKRFDTIAKEEPAKPMEPPFPMPAAAPVQDDEAAAMAAMFQAQTANWEETQEKMSHATKIYTNPRGGPGFNRGGKPFQATQSAESRPLPASYVCYRCGQKGHWIKDCPTNNDREFDNRPRIKRTTGIPRSMLKAVENPTTEQLNGVMVTPEGGYVVAQPDSVAWQKKVSRPKGLTVAEVRERPPTDATLACPTDGRLFRDAVKTPCCNTSYCEECIQTQLLEKDFACPNCGKRVASLDKLMMDKPTRTRVSDYIEKAMEESRNAEDAAAEGAGGDTDLDQELYTDQQPGQTSVEEVQQMLMDSLPQLQAQIHQLSTMLQGRSLPNDVRQTTEMQLNQLRMQMAQAQAMLALGQQLPPGTMWPNGPGMPSVPGMFGGGQTVPEKRGRPDDFGDAGAKKAARFW